MWDEPHAFFAAEDTSGQALVEEKRELERLVGNAPDQHRDDLPVLCTAVEG